MREKAEKLYEAICEVYSNHGIVGDNIDYYHDRMYYQREGAKAEMYEASVYDDWESAVINLQQTLSRVQQMADIHKMMDKLEEEIDIYA